MSALNEFELISRAHADGSQNLPATDDPDPNAAQREIVEWCEKELGKLHDATERVLRDYAIRLEKYNLSPGDLDIDGPVDEVRHELVKLRREAGEAFARHRSAERERFQELRYFKAENRLYRSASYLKSRTLAAGLLLALITGEAVLNAKLFAQADPLGLLGGWLQALIVSVLNVLPSFLAGIVILRNLNHVRSWRRALAAAGSLAFLALMVGYNLLVAHYRVALAVDPDNALLLAAPAVWADPLAFTRHVEAVFLFGLGLFAAACAAIDGYCLFDDRYPGYGKVDRRYRATLEARDEAKRRFVRRIERLVRKAIQSIDRRVRNLSRKVGRAARVVHLGLTKLARAEQRAEATTHRSDRLLRIYREENTKVRTTRPPAYFEHYPVLETNLGLSVDRLVEKQRAMKAALEAKVREAATAKAKLREFAEREAAGLGRFAPHQEAPVEAGTDDGTPRARVLLGARS